MQTAVVLGERYRLGALIGRGGMADVFRAHDLRTDREVAVKLFRPGLDLAETRRRRRRELTTLASLEHDGLVSLLDAEAGDGPGSDALYIVVELVEGPTLRERFLERPLADRDVAGLGAALCDAVAYMHRRGVVHRDIKPANVLLARDDGRLRPKLTDFGIARMVDSTRMTADGLTVGTANYLSPEQVLGEDVDTPSDVYSLGLVLIEALTGAVAFPGHGVQAALARLHRQPQVPSRISPRLSDLLARMTARDPHLRPSARQAAAEFAAVAESSLVSDVLAIGHDAGDPPTDVIAFDARGRRRATVALAAVTAVAAAVAAVWIGAAGHVDGHPASALQGPPRHAARAPARRPSSTGSPESSGSSGAARQTPPAGSTAVQPARVPAASSQSTTAVRPRQDVLAARSFHHGRHHGGHGRTHHPARHHPAHPGRRQSPVAHLTKHATARPKHGAGTPPMHPSAPRPKRP